MIFKRGVENDYHKTEKQNSKAHNFAWICWGQQAVGVLLPNLIFRWLNPLPISNKDTDCRFLGRCMTIDLAFCKGHVSNQPPSRESTKTS